MGMLGSFDISSRREIAVFILTSISCFSSFRLFFASLIMFLIFLGTLRSLLISSNSGFNSSRDIAFTFKKLTANAFFLLRQHLLELLLALSYFFPDFCFLPAQCGNFHVVFFLCFFQFFL